MWASTRPRRACTSATSCRSLTARRLQLAGHRPLLLVGGATGQIGDPKESAERTLNPPEVIAGWVERIRDQLAPFVVVHRRQRGAAGQQPGLDRRDVGGRVPPRRRQALPGQQDAGPGGGARPGWRRGISFTEFSYQLLQANDFFELHRRHGCQLQFGGSDQWGNITAGVDYVRRRGAGPVQAFTTPAGHQVRRHQVRQDRGRRRLARPRR